ncbi:hypothetical protein KAH55_10780 [bacterium]|nr:hypothetical protein [bacterium]
MTRFDKTTLIGGGIVCIGILLLLTRLNFLQLSFDFSLAGCFAILGIVFWGFYLDVPQRYYFLLSGITSWVLAGMIAINSLRVLASEQREEVALAVFLVGCGVMLLSLFWTKRSRNWIILPAGLVTALGIVTVFRALEWLYEGNLWVLFLVLLALSSMSVYWTTAASAPRPKWARNLAFILLAISGLTFLDYNSSEEWMGLIFASFVVLAGLFLIYLGLKRKRGAKLQEDNLPIE